MDGGQRDINDRLAQHWEALRPTYELIVEWVRQVQSPPAHARFIERLAGIADFLVWVNVIPLLPLLVAQIPIGDGPLNVGDVPVLAATWAGLAIGSLALARLARNLARAHVPARRPAPESLTPSQLTFVHAYLAQRDLQAYLDTSLEARLEACLRHVEQLFLPRQIVLAKAADRPETSSGHQRVILAVGGLSRFPSAIAPGWPARLSPLEGALRLAKQNDWFRLDDLTERRVEALTLLSPKLIPRLRSKQDLAQAMGALAAFSDFAFWSELRDSGTSSGASTETRTGLETSLDSLATALDAMPVIQDSERGTSETTTGDSAERVWRQLVDSIGIRFVAWTTVCMFLAVFLALAAKAFLKISDDTIAIIAIPTAFTAGAALTVLTRRNPADS